jgi:hypothetical protein
VLLNVFFVLLAYSGKAWGSGYLLVTMFTISFFGIGLLYYRRPRTKLVVAKHLNETISTEFKQTTKVVTLTKEAIAAEQN